MSPVAWSNDWRCPQCGSQNARPQYRTNPDTLGGYKYLYAFCKTCGYYEMVNPAIEPKKEQEKPSLDIKYVPINTHWRVMKNDIRIWQYRQMHATIWYDKQPDQDMVDAYIAGRSVGREDAGALAEAVLELYSNRGSTGDFFLIDKDHLCSAVALARKVKGE